MERFFINWVKTEIELPQKCTNTLCYIKEEDIILPLFFDGDSRFYLEITEQEYLPTHWCLYPEKPYLI